VPRELCLRITQPDRTRAPSERLVRPLGVEPRLLMSFGVPEPEERTHGTSQKRGNQETPRGGRRRRRFSGLFPTLGVDAGFPGFRGIGTRRVQMSENKAVHHTPHYREVTRRVTVPDRALIAAVRFLIELALACL
jgi:hypothetical protein